LGQGYPSGREEINAKVPTFPQPYCHAEGPSTMAFKVQPPFMLPSPKSL
jgi:hypothetical protein